MKRLLIFAIIIWTNTVIQAQTRITQTINDNWKFYPGGFAFAQRADVKGFPVPVDDLWKTINLPHTWNAEDPFDDVESYRRGIGWYRKELNINESMKGRKIYLFFEGANQKTDVYVNGAFAGSHKGGYTAFNIDITKFVKFDSPNLIAVKVDNSLDNTIPPLSVGYALYGGIYRDVWLKTTNRIHVGMLNHGSSGVFVSTPQVSDEKATVKVKGYAVNESSSTVSVRVKQTIFSPDGTEVANSENTSLMVPGNHFHFTSPEMKVTNPQLWSPEHPVLYSVKTEVFADGKLVDELTSPLGFRWFSFDSQKGFFLNGKKYTLHGTNRHQDFEGLGSALPNSLHVSDLEWIKAMGANFVRMAHYPQDPTIPETADRLGLLLWEEIPVVNYVNRSDEFKANAENMLKEMIRQKFNHPSIIIWGTCNEIFLWDEQGKRAKSINDKGYQEWVHDFVAGLDSIARKEDPGRYITLAMHGSKDYHKAGIDTIPMIASYNLYEGWYSGVFSGFGKALDRIHAQNPKMNIFVSEYGAGSDTRISATQPERFDFSVNWQRMFNESYLQQIKDRPWLAGTAIWNQFDFSQPHTGGTIQHINQKGLQTWNRTPKDTWYLYQANWSKEPMVYIASRDWKQRVGISSIANDYLSAYSNRQPVDVYTNLESAELFCNGKQLGKQKADAGGKITWQVPLAKGENIVLVKAKSGKEIKEDFLKINFKTLSTNLNPGEEIFVNAGAKTVFNDGKGALWLPDLDYQNGFYGNIGGVSKMAEKDLIIVNAKQRADIFNYYDEGLETYKFDVPDGNYFVEVFLAEPEYFEPGKRIFSISVNKCQLFKNLDLASEYGFLNAFSKGILADATNGEGIKISFSAKTGNTLVNAIHIKRID
ncbi:glycoside hydrolase family 2 TIM barrel-domain containing protein [uncultured Draconibacterium sp.]|uniref:glycoside hydrolase family 2 TIM barrel-domain containing protein n=1 Tax=uncultured Draconibacterium sp. TaxID=1573823 RepID=UPI0029C69D7A|nr:glycoside hydrolase family 2 TIM barrel-domain containing protein [uncultured Draconibacterium sp.]